MSTPPGRTRAPEASISLFPRSAPPSWNDFAVKDAQVALAGTAFRHHGAAPDDKITFDVRNRSHRSWDRRPRAPYLLPPYFTKYQFSGVMDNVGDCGKAPSRLVATSVSC